MWHMSPLSVLDLCLKELYTQSALCMSLQVANFQRCEPSKTTSLTSSLCSARSLLMKPWGNWRPRERAKRDRGSGRNWRTGEITKQEMARGFFEEALFVFETQDLNLEWYTKVAAAVQNAIQRYRVIYDEGKRAATQMSWDHLLERGDRIETSREPETVPSVSGMSDVAAGPPSTIGDDPSAVPSPSSPPSST